MLEVGLLIRGGDARFVNAIASAETFFAPDGFTEEHDLSRRVVGRVRVSVLVEEV